VVRDRTVAGHVALRGWLATRLDDRLGLLTRGAVQLCRDTRLCGQRWTGATKLFPAPSGPPCVVSCRGASVSTEMSVSMRPAIIGSEPRSSSVKTFFNIGGTYA
jgi:hypothetical protein